MVTHPNKCIGINKKFADRNKWGSNCSASIGSDLLDVRWGAAIIFELATIPGLEREWRGHDPEWLRGMLKRPFQFLERNLIQQRKVMARMADRPFMLASPKLPLPEGGIFRPARAGCFGVLLVPERTRTTCDDAPGELEKRQRLYFRDCPCAIRVVGAMQSPAEWVQGMLQAMESAPDFRSTAVWLPKDRCLVRQYHHRDPMIGAYDDTVRGWLEEDESNYAVTLTVVFNELRGSSGAVLDQIRQEWEMVYGRLLKGMHARPGCAGAQKHHPRMVVAPDLLVAKKGGGTLGIRAVAPNDGLHGHGVLVASERSRLGRDIAAHINGNQRLFCGSHGKVLQVHAQHVGESEGDFVGYHLKHIANDRTPGRMALDNVWLFPKSTSEQTPRAEYRRMRRTL